MRMYQEDLGQRAGRRGLQTAWLYGAALGRDSGCARGCGAPWVGCRVQSLISSHGAELPVTPYLGHSFSLLRMTIDPRPQAMLVSLTDGLRLLLVL